MEVSRGGTRIYLASPGEFDREHWPDRVYPGVGRNKAVRQFCEECRWRWCDLYRAGWRTSDLTTPEAESE